MTRCKNVLVALAIVLMVTPSLTLAGGATASLNASSLSLSIIPSKLPADGSTYPSVVVSLVEQAGTPTVALTDVTVFLSASQNNVGALPASVTIPMGKTFVIANFTTTTTPGQTVITASSPGLGSSSAQLTTLTPSGFPTHIQVFASPSILLARPSNQPSDQGTITVELTDDQGLPAKAPSSFAISLFSSTTSVVGLVQSLLGDCIQSDSCERLLRNFVHTRIVLYYGFGFGLHFRWNNGIGGWPTATKTRCFSAAQFAGYQFKWSPDDITHRSIR